MTAPTVAWLEDEEAEATADGLGKPLQENLLRFWTYRSTASPPPPRGVLVWTKLHESNGGLAGRNNRVKVIKPLSYDYRTTWTYIANI